MAKQCNRGHDGPRFEGAEEQRDACNEAKWAEAKTLAFTSEHREGVTGLSSSLDHLLALPARQRDGDLLESWRAWIHTELPGFCIWPKTSEKCLRYPSFF